MCECACVVYIADCKGKTNHSSLYLHFAYVYLDSIRWHLILSGVCLLVRACICCRISEFFMSQRLFLPLFPLLSCATRFSAGVGFCGSHTHTLSLSLSKFEYTTTYHPKSNVYSIHRAHFKRLKSKN